MQRYLKNKGGLSVCVCVYMCVCVCLQEVLWINNGKDCAWKVSFDINLEGRILKVKPCRSKEVRTGPISGSPSGQTQQQNLAKNVKSVHPFSTNLERGQMANSDNTEDTDDSDDMDNGCTRKTIVDILKICNAINPTNANDINSDDPISCRRDTIIDILKLHNAINPTNADNINLDDMDEQMTPSAVGAIQLSMSARQADDPISSRHKPFLFLFRPKYNADNINLQADDPIVDVLKLHNVINPTNTDNINSDNTDDGFHPSELRI